MLCVVDVGGEKAQHKQSFVVPMDRIRGLDTACAALGFL